MQPMFLDDPAWRTTFPHRVAPLPDEWLTGLLLRCDEANHWESGTTFWSVTRACTVTDQQRWKRNMRDMQRWKRNIPSFILPSPVNISALAHYLGMEKRLCLSTTYYEELVRCYDLVTPQPNQLYPFFAFRLCPACLAEARLLRRWFLLPCLRYCPHHQVALLKTCSCDTPLFPFNQHTPPFTCPSCRLDWAHLPLIQAQASYMKTEKKLLSHFTWLLTQGSPALLMSALECINENLSGKERDALGEWSNMAPNAGPLLDLAQGNTHFAWRSCHCTGESEYFPTRGFRTR